MKPAQRRKLVAVVAGAVLGMAAMIALIVLAPIQGWLIVWLCCLAGFLGLLALTLVRD